MWLLALAVLMLYVSAVLTSFYSLSLTKESWERPPLLMGRSETLFLLVHVAVSVIGAAALFVAVGWKWWLIGLGTYWVLVVFVLMPTMDPIPFRSKPMMVIHWPLLIVGKILGRWTRVR